jgi:PEGA domain-containing protein
MAFRSARSVLRSVQILLVLLSLCASASAEPGDEREQARALAEQAGDALDSRDFARAVELVNQAEALYHAPTHLIIAAEAHEGLGELVEAAELYERIVAEPLPAGSPSAFKSAKSDAVERSRALIARIPSLLLRISPASARAEVTLDGQPVEAGAETAKRVNPGTHTIRASAPGFATYEKSVELKRGGVVTIEITLQREGAAEPAPPPIVKMTAPESAPPQVERSSRSKLPAFIAFGVGAVGLGVGAVTGKMSLDRVSELEDACPERRCSSAHQGDIDDAKLLGTVSTIGFGVGAVGVAAGIVLLVTSGSTDEKQAATTHRRVEPWIGARALGLRGSF